jgi:hypothetical protein
LRAKPFPNFTNSSNSSPSPDGVPLSPLDPMIYLHDPFIALNNDPISILIKSNSNVTSLGITA